MGYGEFASTPGSKSHGSRGLRSGLGTGRTMLVQPFALYDQARKHTRASSLEDAYT